MNGMEIIPFREDSPTWASDLCFVVQDYEFDEVNNKNDLFLPVLRAWECLAFDQITLKLRSS